MAGIINYLIGAAAILFGIFKLRAKSAEDPAFKIAGIGVKSLLNLAYLGIACYIILVLMLALE